MFRYAKYESRHKVTHLMRHIAAETLVTRDVDLADINTKGGWEQGIA